MGTVASLDLRNPQDLPPSIVDEAFTSLHDADARLSPFLERSELCRWRRGELSLWDASADLREVLRLGDFLRDESRGAFDIRRHRDDGRADPTGVVKGWATERAALILLAGGARDFCLNVGGDVVVHGEPRPGRPWRVGIRHPARPDRVAAVLGVRDAAVATSGGYERGEHIRDGRTGSPAAGLRSMTVVGPRMTLADGYATAAFAMGLDGPGWLTTIPGYSGAAITEDDRVLLEDAFAALLVDA